MPFLRSIWFDRAAFILFALRAFGSFFLPEIVVIHHRDGSVDVMVDIIADPPTGHRWDSTAYTPWPFVLLFAATSYYYLVRANRPDPAPRPYVKSPAGTTKNSPG